MGGFEDRGERRIGRAAFTQVQTFKPGHEELPFQQQLIESRAWLLNQSVQRTKQKRLGAQAGRLRCYREKEYY
jgi:hypothetical protein